MAGCLDGIRVLELARFQAGPRGGMVLSDLGAEVIKVEQPGGEHTRGNKPMANGASVYFSTYNRGKKSICLDLRKAEGKAVFLDLVKKADFVLENFRPGTMEKMGLGYDDLCKVKPDIILIRVSAYGQYGTHKNKAGFDPLGQALSGLMSLTGQQEGKPIGTAFSVVDRLTALHATIGALGALHHRNQTGQGQVIETSLMDAGWTTVEIPAAYHLNTGKEGGEGGRPPYRARDGWVVATAATPGQRQRLLVKIAPPSSGDSRELPPASLRLETLPEVLGKWCAENTVEHICRTLDELDIPVAPVRTVAQAVKDPHLWERELQVKVRDQNGGQTYAPGLPMKFSRTPGKTGDVPAAGEHSDAVMRDVAGYSADRVAELRRSGVLS